MRTKLTDFSSEAIGKVESDERVAADQRRLTRDGTRRHETARDGTN